MLFLVREMDNIRELDISWEVKIPWKGVSGQHFSSGNSLEESVEELIKRFNEEVDGNSSLGIRKIEEGDVVQLRRVRPTESGGYLRGCGFLYDGSVRFVKIKIASPTDLLKKYIYDYNKMKIPKTVGDFAKISRKGQEDEPGEGISLQIARYGKCTKRSKTARFENIE